jgi:O-antigen/teichoic acid export membrane protein
MLLIAGAYLATLTPLPAAMAALTMAVASIVGSMLLSRMLWNYEPWNPQAPLGILREIAPVGSWSAFGGAVHWMFSQGYNYIVAGSLDVSAVAALAATRLLVMPVNLLSSGIGNQLLPSVSRWMQSRKPAAVFARLALAATGLACLSCCYLAIMWFGRGWIYHDVLKKSFLHRDQLLMVWCVISIVMVYRDQLLHFLVVRTSFRVTSSLTLLSAIIATTISLLSMPRIGAIGALIGLLTGEVINVLGIAGMSLREVRLMNASARVAHPA